MNNLTEIRNYAEVLKEIKTELEIISFDSDELQELCKNLGGADFHIKLDGGEYRFIHDTEIEDIYAESIQELFESCYNLDDIPLVLSCHIDWDGVVRDCMIDGYMIDGYGHLFSSYDGYEHNAGDYYIFRTN